MQTERGKSQVRIERGKSQVQIEREKSQIQIERGAGEAGTDKTGKGGKMKEDARDSDTL